MTKTLAANENEYHFEIDMPPGVSLSNFYPPETGFVWSTQKWCEVRFNIPTATLSVTDEIHEPSLKVTLDIDVFKTQPNLVGQNVFFYLNGLRVGSRFVTSRITVSLRVQLQYVRYGVNVITIDTPDSARPAVHGIEDTRLLGIQLFSVRTTVA